MATKRRRRTAEEARQAILSATEERLVSGGPSSIRLQEVARAVGVSHPTVLHHFGSRDGLIDAVVARAFEALYTDVVIAISDGAGADGHARSLIERVHETMVRGGHARTMAWLALEGMAGHRRFDLGAVISAAHATRKAHCESQGWAVPDREDTAMVVLLATFTIFGQAVVGEHVFESAGFDDAGLGFRGWFAELVRERLESSEGPG